MSNIDVLSNLDELEGNVYRRGDDGYEKAREETVWHSRTPERYPELIVQAETEAAVVQAISSAAAASMKVGIRSGGHSYTGTHLRDGGMLLDVSRMNDVRFEGDDIISVQPGCRGTDLVAALAEKDLFFPVGHCPDVGLGGYLLSGGFGWFGRTLGPACISIVGIDVVTADGELVQADEDKNSDLLWAARGAGPGFFGVVTRFRLKVYPKPKFVFRSLYRYPLEDLEDVFRWLHEIGPDVEPLVALTSIIVRGEDDKPFVGVMAFALADSEQVAKDALLVLDTCPVVEHAQMDMKAVPSSFEAITGEVRERYPVTSRYAVDAMWMKYGQVEELIPHLKKIADGLPNQNSEFLWFSWGGAKGRTDTALLEDDIQLSLYHIWTDPSEDETHLAAVGRQLREMEPIATGIPLGGENLGRRPTEFLDQARMSKLDELRAKYDPDQRFHQWMGRAS